jgi:hypothetical protein
VTARTTVVEAADRADLMGTLGMRFGMATVSVLIPLQLATGKALARALAVSSLVGSLVVVLLATALPVS